MKKVILPTDLLAAALTALGQKLQVETAYGNSAQNIAQLKALRQRTEDALNGLYDDPIEPLRHFKAYLADDKTVRRANVYAAFETFIGRVADNVRNQGPETLDSIVALVELATPEYAKAVDQSLSNATFHLVKTLASKVVPDENKFSCLLEVFRRSDAQILCGAGVPGTFFDHCETIADLFDAAFFLLILEEIGHKTSLLTDGDTNGEH